MRNALNLLIFSLTSIVAVPLVPAQYDRDSLPYRNSWEQNPLQSLPGFYVGNMQESMNGNPLI